MVDNKQLTSERDNILTQLNNTSLEEIRQCLREAETKFMNYSMAHNPISKEELETYTKDVEKLIDEMSKWKLLFNAVWATKQIFANIK